MHAMSLTSESSPGMDKISYALIKNSHQSLQERILEVFNHLYAANLFPQGWGTATIIPIERPEKDTTQPLES